MPNILSKLIGRQPLPQSTVEDADLEQFFTDAEHARQVFEQTISTVLPTKRLLVIHGVGGVGKSTLLKMYRLSCRRQRIPVALAGGEEAPSPATVLAIWADDLSGDKVTLSTFQAALTRYRALQAKVEAEAKKTSQTMSQTAEKMGKAAVKTAVEMVASTIPVVGPLVAAVGGAGAEAFVDWLRGFLSKLDLEFYLDPTKQLTDDFMTDLIHAAARQRIVLMADTYEQMTTLDDWMRDLARRLPQSVLLVIAGRAVPEWDRAWPGWMGQAAIIEQKEMTPNDLRLLVRRYYAHIHGGEPDPQQVEAVAQFARGLPMVATTVVRLWVKYGIEDFAAVKPKVVADLVDRLLEGVPPDMQPAFEVAAVLRYFNADALRALLEGGDADTLYAELRRWPFIRPRREGLAVHDAMREMMNEALRVRTPERFCALHERAAAYYEARLARATGEEAERLGLERLYHHVRLNEEDGIRLFQEMAEELVRYQLVNRLRALLNDANTYPLEKENSRLWRKYYNGRLLDYEVRITDAEEVYQAISENEQAERKLRAYALCDWGHVWARYERMSQPGGVEKALNLLERSRDLAPQMDSKFVFVFTHLREVYNFKCELVRAIEFPERQLRFFQENNDKYGIVYTLGLLNISYGIIGDWKRAYEAIAQGLEVLNSMPENLYLRMRLLGWGPFAYIWSGRYAEAEQIVRDALSWRVGDLGAQAGLVMYLILASGLQGKYQEASSYFAESLKRYENLGNEFIGGIGILQGFWGVTLARQGELGKAEEHLNQSLSIKRKVQDKIGIPELLNCLGEICEVKAGRMKDNQDAILKTAEDYYRQSLERRVSRFYFECGVLTGLVRVKHAQGDYAAIPPLLAEAEQLAQQYEYNDHLATLRLTQGHIAWDSPHPGPPPQAAEGWERALHYYQHALIYALRYNRFSLDEVLSGRPHGTPLHPIIPHCLERGQEGCQMLVALRNWWRTGVNDIGTPRPDTISPIPEGIPLLEAERIARERERGDGSPQTPVVEQIEKALSQTPS